MTVGGREGGPSDGTLGPLHERGGWWSRPSSRAAQVNVHLKYGMVLGMACGTSYGMVWSGLVWYGVAHYMDCRVLWYGIVWYTM